MSGRDFLVKRLMEDSKKIKRMRDSSPEKSDSTTSSSSSADGEHFTLPSPLAAQAATTKFCHQLGGGGGAVQPGSPLAAQYAAAATLASLAFFQQQQPAGSVSGLSLLYPHLYQSLMNFQDIDEIRRVVQSAMTLAAHNAPNSCFTQSRSEFDEKPSNGDNVKSSPQVKSARKRPTAESAKKLNGNGDLTEIIESPPKKRATRRLQFDEETSSPVSGMYIKPVKGNTTTTTTTAEIDFEHFTSGDIDESLNLVEETEEARQKLAEIPNLIGDYICQLCKTRFADAFKLAQHRCPRIGHVEYRCPECDKVFNCPANLASHRRWHRPKERPSNNDNQQSSFVLKPVPIVAKAAELRRQIAHSTMETGCTIEQQPLDLSAKQNGAESQNNHESEANECEICNRKFTCHTYLRQHAIKHTAFANADAESEEQCSECPFWFPNRALANGHFLRVHLSQQTSVTVVGQFACKFCSLTFNTSPALTRHINKNHPSQECRIILLEELEASSKPQQLNGSG